MRPRLDDWGTWDLVPGSVELVTDRGGYTYAIDLEDCTTSAQVLDWICQIAGKTWADDATLAGLVRAIDTLLHPQASLCSNGQSKELTPAEIVERVAEWVTRFHEARR